MSKEVIQKDFQGGVVGKIAGAGVIAICAIGFAGFMTSQSHNVMETSPPPTAAQPGVVSVADAPIASQGSDSGVSDANRSVRGSDDYVVPIRDLPKGTRLSAGNLKVVKKPGLVGYELAFYKVEAVNGLTLNHEVKAGQPVLPFHVEESLRKRTYLDMGGSR